jgi:hypothetical protein
LFCFVLLSEAVDQEVDDHDPYLRPSQIDEDECQHSHDATREMALEGHK